MDVDYNSITNFKKPTRVDFDNLVGQTFHYLKVFQYAGKKHNASLWLCLCKCKQFTVVQGKSLKAGTSRSCGCFQLERLATYATKHGQAGKTTYGIWANLKQRCFNPKTRAFLWYGGRGITVCDRWLKFKNFLADMGERPSKEHSIDRIDNDGDYCPENCKWATRQEQANNTRNTRFFVVNGKRESLSNLCRLYNKNYAAVITRLKRGYTIEQALNK
jgi:hypothetical protein